MIGSYNRWTLVVILAGGKGERLGPLTQVRCKPAVPFGGIYRIIDMTLSNCINSGLRRIFVFTQYVPASLNRHLREGWRFISRPTIGEFVESLAPQHRAGEESFRGTADALYQNLTTIEQEDAEVVLVLSGDHIYKMDYRPMLDFHVQTGADMTIGAVEVSKSQASGLGIFEVDTGSRVVGFQEKPNDPKTVPGHPDICLASMGIYAFRISALRKALEASASDPESTHDIGRDIVWRMMRGGPVMAYQFVDMNKKASKYWRDVGTIDAYWSANMDLVAIDPEFNLYDRNWPIYTAQVVAPPPKFIFSQEGPDGRVGTATDSVIAPGTIISGGRVHSSVVGPFCRINSYAQIQESILFDNVDVGRRAVIRRAIIDKDVRIPEGTKIGVNPEEDRKRFYVSPGGIVVIAKGDVILP
ncbi:MAG TPA: glucose-1-phosphate adenylyltransferase [Elusimicrobia bacterium]|nr:glucose-1-phosphate adenylyltransferase [Elusimicrobiota bacterium]HBT62353.1 glucose-1-phosphate adenylyltransferase [Elusimicrobiota bacterium]